jgi:hypothetical protein
MGAGGCDGELASMVVVLGGENVEVGCSPLARLDRVDAFDDARPEAFTSINGEASSDDFWVGLPCLMITGKANRQSFKRSLAGSHHSVGACDMPAHQQLTTSTKHTVHLVNCCRRLRDAAEGKRADDGIEPVVSEWEVLGVSLDEDDVNADLGALPRAISSMAGLKSIPVSWIPPG